MTETPQEYTARILSYVEGKDPMKVQSSTVKRIERLIKNLSPKQLKKNPTAGKWSIAEIIAHLAEAELVGGYRLRMILSLNGTPIQAFDQNVWMEGATYLSKHPKQALTMFQVLRENNIAFYKAIPKEQREQYGMHAERGKETINHIFRLYAGHDLNHLMQIERIVKETK
jgi:uncharacterized damage-inducible protein DinB